MKKRKPNHRKWLADTNWNWWQTMCLLADMEPPETVEEYYVMRMKYEELYEIEKKWEKEDFFVGERGIGRIPMPAKKKKKFKAAPGTVREKGNFKGTNDKA